MALARDFQMQLDTDIVALQNCSTVGCRGLRTLEVDDDVAVCTQCGKQLPMGSFNYEAPFESDELTLESMAKPKVTEQLPTVVLRGPVTPLDRAKAVLRQQFHNTVPFDSIIDLYERYAKLRGTRINNHLSTLCACMILLSERTAIEMPLNIGTVTKRCGIELSQKYYLFESIRRNLRSIRIVLKLPRPSLPVQIRHWIEIFQMEINDGKINPTCLNRIEHQTQWVLQDVQTVPRLKDRSAETIAATVLLLALKGFKIVHHQQSRIVSVEFLHRITGVGTKPIHETVKMCRQIPILLNSL